MCYWCTAVYKHMLAQVWTQKTNTGLSGTNSHTAGTCLITNSVYSGCEVIAECQNNWHSQHIQLPTVSQLETLTLTSWQADATILLGTHILKYPHYLFFFWDIYEFWFKGRGWTLFFLKINIFSVVTAWKLEKEIWSHFTAVIIPLSFKTLTQ